MTRAALYGMAGAALSLGAPLGLLAVRASILPSTSLALLWADVQREAPSYGYVALSTCIAFVLFGRTLGARADALIALSSRDPVTGLLNRSTLDSRLDEELDRAGRYVAPMSLLMIDVDALKKINDREGHRAGDAALRAVAAAIRTSCRRTDFAGRWGGDEFVVVAPSTALDASSNLAERICQAVRSAAGGPPLTVSIGVTETKGYPETAAAVLDRADRALYAAKRGGRDRAVTLRHAR